MGSREAGRCSLVCGRGECARLPRGLRRCPLSKRTEPAARPTRCWTRSPRQAGSITPTGVWPDSPAPQFLSHSAGDASPSARGRLDHGIARHSAAEGPPTAPESRYERHATRVTAASLNRPLCAIPHSALPISALDGLLKLTVPRRAVDRFVEADDQSKSTGSSPVASLGLGRLP